MQLQALNMTLESQFISILSARRAYVLIKIQVVRLNHSLNENVLQK